MPWRGPLVPREYPTLGYAVIAYIEANCAIPDGNRIGDPYLLTDEMQRFLLHFYRLHPDARADPDKPGRAFVHDRGGQLVRPQKWGKGPFSAAIICAEAAGPVIFDGWDADGEPVGRPWPTPLIQVTAVSEDQTDNVFRALVPMIELGTLNADIPDTGQTRINLPGGGRIEPVTSSALSRLGQRITFSVQDETHGWTAQNRGRKLADNQRRNLSGMTGRFLETTNAWDPAEESVAQQTFEGKEPGVYFDFAEPGPGSVRNKRERRKCMKRVYGDSATAPADGRWKPWVDLDRIDSEIEALLARDPAQAERFFLNRIHAGEGTAFDLDRWKQLSDATFTVPKGDLVVAGVDGARTDDALAIIATHVASGFQWPVTIVERPPGADDTYEHDLLAVDGAMTDFFEHHNVWRIYIDPQRIEPLVEKWQGRYGEKRVLEWTTHRPRQIAYAVRAYRLAQSAGDLAHNGDEVFTRHIGNSRRYKVQVYDEDHHQMWTLSKDRPMSPRKIDAAMAGVLSWEARGDAIAAGALKRRSRTPVSL